MAFPVSQERIAESGLTQEQVSAWEEREIRWWGNVAKVLWGGEMVLAAQQMAVAQRLGLAAQLLHDRVKINLSIPVKKIPRIRVNDTSETWMGHPTISGGPIGSQYTYVPPESRSKPGEFPRADQTHLMDSIWLEGPDQEGDEIVCRVGMPLAYGLRLELHMGRSFLVRTLNEEWPQLQQVVSGAH